MFLESEKNAIALFHEKGREGCNWLLDELSKIAKERYENAPDIPKDWTPFDFLTSSEQILRQTAILALMLCTNPQQEARMRITDHLEKRNFINEISKIHIRRFNMSATSFSVVRKWQDWEQLWNNGYRIETISEAYEYYCKCL